MRRLSPRLVPLVGLLSLGLTGVHASTTGPEPAWTAVYNSLGRNTDAGRAVTTDAQGNAYVAGYMYRRGAELDFVVLKYARDGRPVWRTSYDGPTHHTDVPSGIAVDGSGNVYVAGRSARSSGTDHDYVLLKYSASGRLLWSKRRPGAPFIQSNGDYTPVHLAVDAAGNAYVSGYADGGFRTTKYNPFGAEVWSDAYGNPGQPLPVSGFNQTALAPDGGLLLAGALTVSLDQTDLLVVRYSPEGERSVILQRPAPNGLLAAALAVAPEPGGGFTVAGVERANSSGVPADLLVARYAADGTELWVRTYSREAQSEDVPVAVVRDAAGNVIVTGYTQQPHQASTADVITLKYNADGDLQWALAYDGPRGREDRPQALGLDSTGLIYVGGTVDAGEGETQNYGLLKISPTGELVSAACWDGPAGRLDEVAGMAVDAEGAVTLTGISALSGTPARGYDYGIVTLRYDAGLTGPALVDFKLLSARVRGGKPIRGVIRLSEKAKANGVVQLQSSNPDVLPVPAAGIPIQRGHSTAVFTLRSVRVNEPVDVTLTATLGGISKQALITIRP